MIISVNWLKKFVDIDMSVDDLVALIGSRLVEVEEVIDLGQKYKDATVVKVLQASRIEGSDHLSLVRIDDGGLTELVDRDYEGYIQVVCGALNISSGQMVVWLPPKSVVPNTCNKPEPFILGSRKLHGFVSHGMIASPYELDMSDDHDGILVIDDDIQLGTKFSTAYEYDDYLLDIENKSLTHRPDCFGIIGFAREVAAITGNKFKTPDWLMNLEPVFSEGELSLTVKIDNKELSPRYQAVVMSNINGESKSPLLIQTYLSRVGMRPINAVVDVTNYLMVLTGQPLHAFDYDKLLELNGGKAELNVRSGRSGEKLKLLDAKDVELSSDDIVIAAGEKVIALAGAMGGASTVIDENTNNVIIECATFNLYNLRGTQMRHGIFSEAITRFTKGQPASLTAPVLFDALRLLRDWTGAHCSSGLVEDYPKKQIIKEIDFSIDQINEILGTVFNVDDVVHILNNIEFDIVKISGRTLTIKPPYWRADIHIIEDIAEEIGRLSGFDNIKSVLPMRDFAAISPSGFDDFRENLRNILSKSGANEVLTYSFLHGDIIKKSCQDVSNSYRIVNSISPNLQYYRQSLTPSLLDIVHMNIKNGFNEFAIFEINKSHSKIDGLNDEKVPVESNKLALVYSSKLKQPGSSYYKVKNVIDYVFNVLNLEVEYVPLIENSVDSPPFESKRSASIKSKSSGNTVGVIGEYKKSVSKGFKLTDYTAGFEINTESIYKEVAGKIKTYSKISRYPSTERDICFKVNSDVNYESIIKSLNKNTLEDYIEVYISPVDIYSCDDGTKNITVRIKLTSFSGTLNNEEINKYINGFVEPVKSDLKAKVI